MNPHQIMTAESKPTEARYRSPGDHARSVTSAGKNERFRIAPDLRDKPLSWPGSRFKAFQPSTLISSEPHTFPRAPLIFAVNANQHRWYIRATHGSWSQTITVWSSLPLASHFPECAHLTTNTGPPCIVRVQSDFGGFPDSSDASFRMGLVLHIRIFASSPPVAIREPSG